MGFHVSLGECSKSVSHRGYLGDNGKEHGNYRDYFLGFIPGSHWGYTGSRHLASSR